MKFLKNRKTGVVYPYSKLLAAKTNMEPSNAVGGSPFETVSVDLTAETESETSGDSAPVNGQGTTATEDPAAAPAVDSSGGIIISRARKADLLQYAMQNFSVDLDEGKTLDELRKEVRALVENN